MRRWSSVLRWLAILSDNAFRSLTSEVSSTGTPCSDTEARSPRSSGGRSAASVSQVRAEPVDGNTRALRWGTATTCHSSPLAACTVRICTRSFATAISAGASPFSTSIAASR